jgi:hypothetical protein
MNAAIVTSSNRTPRLSRTAALQSVLSLLTPGEVALRLQISTRKVAQLLSEWKESGGADGIPGGVKIGRSWRIDRNLFENWLKAQRVSGTVNPGKSRLQVVRRRGRQ